MFVEKLSKEEIEDYLKKYIWPNRKYAFLIGPKNVENFKVEDGQISCNIPTIDYIFRDFRLTEFSSYTAPEFEIRPSWLKFMYSKFGVEYKKAFLEFRAYNKNAAMRKAEEKYDNQTNEFAKNFDAGQGK